MVCQGRQVNASGHGSAVAVRVGIQYVRRAIIQDSKHQTFGASNEQKDRAAAHVHGRPGGRRERGPRTSGVWTLKGAENARFWAHG